MMNDKSKDIPPVSPPEDTSQSKSFQPLTEEERKALEVRLRKQQEQEDRSLEEGFRFLYRSVFQFIFFIIAGVFVIMFSRDLLAAKHPGGLLLMALGVGLIIKGMISLGGFNAK